MNKHSFGIWYSHIVQSPHRIQNSNDNRKLFRFSLLTIFFFFFHLQILFSLFTLISNHSIMQKSQTRAKFEFWNWFWSQLWCSFCYCLCSLSLSLSFCWNAMLFIKKHSCTIYFQFLAFLLAEKKKNIYTKGKTEKSIYKGNFPFTEQKNSSSQPFAIVFEFTFAFVFVEFIHWLPNAHNSFRFVQHVYS